MTPSGCRVSVHDPEVGSPEIEILPVEILHEGWVTVPITGIPGISGPWMIMTDNDGIDVQPASFVTVNVNVPAGNPVIRVVLPEPWVTSPPGLRVMFQIPEGRPDNTTVPVGDLHEG